MNHVLLFYTTKFFNRYMIHIILYYGFLRHMWQVYIYINNSYIYIYTCGLRALERERERYCVWTWVNVSEPENFGTFSDLILGLESAFAFRIFTHTQKHQKAVRSRSLSSWKIVYPLLFFSDDLMSWFMVSLTAFLWVARFFHQQGLIYRTQSHHVNWWNLGEQRIYEVVLVWCGTFHWHHLADVVTWLDRIQKSMGNSSSSTIIFKEASYIPHIWTP